MAGTLGKDANSYGISTLIACRIYRVIKIMLKLPQDPQRYWTYEPQSQPPRDLLSQVLRGKWSPELFKAMFVRVQRDNEWILDMVDWTALYQRIEQMKYLKGTAAFFHPSDIQHPVAVLTRTTFPLESQACDLVQDLYRQSPIFEYYYGLMQVEGSVWMAQASLKPYKGVIDNQELLQHLLLILNLLEVYETPVTSGCRWRVCKGKVAITFRGQSYHLMPSSLPTYDYEPEDCYSSVKGSEAGFRHLLAYYVNADLTTDARQWVYTMLSLPYESVVDRVLQSVRKPRLAVQKAPSMATTAPLQLRLQQLGLVGSISVSEVDSFLQALDTLESVPKDSRSEWIDTWIPIMNAIRRKLPLPPASRYRSDARSEVPTIVGKPARSIRGVPVGGIVPHNPAYSYPSSIWEQVASTSKAETIQYRRRGTVVSRSQQPKLP